MRQFQRVLALLGVVPILAAGRALPPAHAHETDGDHHRQTVHRHLDPHAAPEADHGATAVHSDDGVTWLDQQATGEVAFQLKPAVPGAPLAATAICAPSERVVPTIDESAPPHGPPRQCLSYRGPPPPRLS